MLSELGIEAKTFDDRSLDQVRGIIIFKIDKNSIIQDTNMEREFIVTAVNEESIDNLDDFTAAVAKAEGEVILDGFYKKYPGEYSYVFEKE